MIFEMHPARGFADSCLVEEDLYELQSPINRHYRGFWQRMALSVICLLSLLDSDSSGHDHGLILRERANLHTAEQVVEASNCHSQKPASPPPAQFCSLLTAVQAHYASGQSGGLLFFSFY
jgi:hypothetical protein